MKNRVLLLLFLLTAIIVLSSCNLTSLLVSDIVIENSNVEIYVGESTTVEYTVYPEFAKGVEINWESSDSNVAVFRDGAVFGVSPGVATITLKSKNGVSEELTVKVLEIVDNPPEEEVPVEKNYTLKTGYTIDFNSSKKDKVQINGTIAIIVIDDDSRIVSCFIDTFEHAAYLYDKEPSISSLKTKKQIGDEYMLGKYGFDVNGDGVIKKWYEQAAEFEKYVIGKTVDEVCAMTTITSKDGYITSSDDDLLNAGCTIDISDFINAISNTVNDSEAVSFVTKESFDLTVSIESSKNYSYSATDLSDGAVCIITKCNASVNQNNNTLSSSSFSICPEARFDLDGEITDTVTNIPDNGIRVTTLKDLNNNPRIYTDRKISVEGTVVGLDKDSYYAEISYYDENTSTSYEMKVFLGYNSSLLSVFEVGNNVRVVGYYSNYNGTYEISGLEYDSFNSDSPDSTGIIK